MFELLGKIILELVWNFSCFSYRFFVVFLWTFNKNILFFEG